MSKDKIINSTEMQKRFGDILTKYNKLINHSQLSKSNKYLYLILIKILNNLHAANLLWSIGIYFESFIIIRSAFESFVLFEFLVANPEKIEIYETDSLIAEFKFLFALYKRSILAKINLFNAYKALPEKVQKLLMGVQNGTDFNDIGKLENILNKHKLCSQEVRKMLDSLEQKNTPHSKIINNYLPQIYGVSSVISHGSLNKIVSKLMDNPEINDLRECFRQSQFILCLSITTFKEIIKPKKFDNEIKIIQQDLHSFKEYLEIN